MARILPCFARFCNGKRAWQVREDAQSSLSEVLTGHPPGVGPRSGHVAAGLLHFKELRAERHLLQRNRDDAEPPRDVLAVFEGEPLVRRAAGGLALRQRRADVAVDVRHHEVDLPLRERVEALALEDDAPDVLVVAPGVRLVGRGVGPRVEHPRPPRAVAGRGLDRERVGELGPVVLEHGGEQPPERLGPERPPQPAERVDDVLGALAGQEPRDHEARRREHDRQEDALVAPPALGGVDLRDLHAGVRGQEVLVVLPRAALRAVAVDLVRDGRPPALPVAHGHREVVPPDGQDAPVDVVVGGALAYPERRGRGDHRVVDALAPGEGGDEDLVDGPELALGGVDPLPRLHERPAVALVREPVQVVELAQAAALLVGAAVADVGRRVEARAALLLEARAQALAAPEAAVRAAARAARAPAHPGGVAPVAAGARVEPPPVEGLRGLHAAAHDLPLDGRSGDPRLAADLRERLALAQCGLQREAQVVRQVLVPLFPDCHVGILSSLRRGGIAVPVGKDAIFRLQGKAGISACRTNRAGSPVAPAHLLFQSTTKFSNILFCLPPLRTMTKDDILCAVSSSWGYSSVGRASQWH